MLTRTACQGEAFENDILMIIAELYRVPEKLSRCKRHASRDASNISQVASEKGRPVLVGPGQKAINISGAPVVDVRPGGGGEVTRLGPGLDQCLDCLDPLEKGSLLCYSLRQRALGEGGR